MPRLVAALLRAYALSLSLVTLSGAVPAPCEVTGYEPDEGRLVSAGCPSGSCQERG